LSFTEVTELKRNIIRLFVNINVEPEKLEKMIKVMDTELKSFFQTSKKADKNLRHDLVFLVRTATFLSLAFDQKEFHYMFIDFYRTIYQNESLTLDKLHMSQVFEFFAQD